MSADPARRSTSEAKTLVRRVRLPADRRTPAAARSVVREILADAELSELLDEALLLTTELATNGVMHAGTDLDIEVAADPSGLTVMVTDFAPGEVERFAIRPVARTNERRDGTLPERGRGLLLVDHFASRWGVTHLPTGKGVWFRLDRGTGPHAATPEMAGPTPSTTALTALLQVEPEAYGDNTLPLFAGTLLARLAELVGASGGIIRFDPGDGGGPQILATYGRLPAADPLTVPLGVNRPYAGELELDVPASAWAWPLATLAAERLALHLENDRLRRADIRRQSWLTFLAEASELLAQSLDVRLTMALIPQLVVPRLGQWCAVHTTDESGRLSLAAASHADERMLPDLNAALKEAGPDSVIARLHDASRLGTHVMLAPPLEGFAVPLTARGQRLGTLAVGRHHRSRHDPEEISVLEDVARRAALAIDNARIHEERRRVAHALQQSLLPPVLPLVAGIGFGAEYVPAGDADEVGGDFYDVVPLPQDRWLVVVGDVSGKGVQAAAVTGLVRDVIRVLVQDGRPLAEALSRLNDTLVERGSGRFCTLALAAVGRGADGGLDVALHLAGHDQPVLVRGSGSAEFVGAGGTALGLLRSIESQVVQVSLRPGDSLVFYTDGVTERRHGRELFGFDRLRDAAAPLAPFSAEVVAARLRSTTLAFSPEPPRDDIAILVLRNEHRLP